MSMKRILIIQPLRPEGLEVFAGRKDVSYQVVTDFSEENLLANVGDGDAIAVRTAVITNRVLDAAPRLKVISRHGVGYDNIPVSECTARGIAVTVVGAVNAISVAEHTWFLILAAAPTGAELDPPPRPADFGIKDRVTALDPT